MGGKIQIQNECVWKMFVHSKLIRYSHSWNSPHVISSHSGKNDQINRTLRSKSSCFPDAACLFVFSWHFYFQWVCRRPEVNTPCWSVTSRARRSLYAHRNQWAVLEDIVLAQEKKRRVERGRENRSAVVGTLSWSGSISLYRFSVTQNMWLRFQHRVCSDVVLPRA